MMGVLRLLPWAAGLIVWQRLNVLEARIMDQFTEVLDRIDTATTEVAIEIRDLRDQLTAGGLTPAQEADVLARLGAAADRLEGIATDPDDPVPKPPVGPAPIE